MATPRQLVIVFNGRHIEVDASVAGRRGGLRACAREAELAWGLHPKSYSFFDTNRKVDSQQALQNALSVCFDGTCVLEVRQHPEWQALNMAMKTFESKVLAKVDAALIGMREDLECTDAKVCKSLTPMVRCMALELIGMREAIEETSAKLCTGIAPMVQHLALEQIDLRTRLNDINVEEKIEAVSVPAKSSHDVSKCHVCAPQLVVYPVLEPEMTRHDSTESVNCKTSIETFESEDLEDLNRRLCEDFASRLRDMEEADEFLFKELQAMCDSAKAAQKDIMELQAEVQGLQQKQASSKEESITRDKKTTNDRLADRRADTGDSSWQACEWWT